MLAGLLAVVLAGIAPAAHAQGTPPSTPVSPRLDSLRKLYRLPPAPVRPIVVATFLGAPGSSLGSPSVSGASGGDYFFGAGYQERTRFTDKPDGGFGGGMGFGDPEAGIGLELTASSFSSIRHAPLSIGGVSFKLHHRDAQHLMLYAVGVENVVHWGLTDGGTNAYALMGRVFPLRPGDNAAFGVLSASLGVGNGRFRTQDAVEHNRHSIGVFGGVGLRIVPAVSLTADWTGQDLAAGFTFAPIPGRGIIGSVGFVDLTRSAGDGPRFVMSLGFGLNSRNDKRRLSPEDLSAIFTPRS